jgi:glycosyltransferase involved in cell wall biosynthesis
MNIFQIMGCTSDQYASLENYLVRKAKICKKDGHIFIVGYNNIPKSSDFIKDLTAEGAFLYRLEANSFFDFHFITTFHKIVKEHKIDIVHAYFAPTRHYAIIIAWLLGIKKRYRQGANLPLSQNKKKGLTFKIFIFRHRILSHFATKYICRSNAVKHQYEQMGLNSFKLKVADGGTDTERYKKITNIKRKIFANNSDYVIIGTASRLVKEKGLDILIDAVELLIHRNQRINCAILGDGPEKEYLKRVVENKHLIDYVSILGHNSNVENYYALFDMFVSASFSEGMSNSILEAMACEVPVIISDIEPNKEIIDTAVKSNLYIGELFKTGDKEDLADKIENMIHRNDREIIGKAARQVILDNYSINERITKELEIYKE